MWREVKKREEKRSTPAFFSFFTSRPPLWGSQGAGPLGRGLRVAHERARFAGWRRSLCAARQTSNQLRFSALCGMIQITTIS